MGTFRLVVLFASLCAAPLATQDEPAEPIPDALRFGSLRVGAVAEGSLGVVWNHLRDAESEVVEIDAPKFVTVTRTQTKIWTAALGVRTRVWFRVDTRKAGAIEGTIELRRAGRRVVVPIDAVVLPRDEISTRVVVADSPFQADSTEDGGLLDTWRTLVATGRLAVDYLNPPAKGESRFSVELLREADVVLVGESTLWHLSEADVARLQAFACGGGRVVLAANKFYGDTIAGANRVVAPFGFELLDVEPRGQKQYELTGEHIADDALTRGVTTVGLYRPSPVRIVDEDLARPLITIEDGLAFSAIARLRSGGEVIAIGESLWWDWVAASPSNARFLRNLLVRERKNGAVASASPELPLLLTEDFENGRIRWTTTDDSAWRIEKVDGSHVFGLIRRRSDYQPKVRSPHNIALLYIEATDFVLTFDVKSTKDTGNHRDCCVFFGYQNPTNFYYAHLGARPDPHSGQIMLVKDAPRRALTTNEKRVPWDDGWHKVKVVRDSGSGKIEVYFDDMETPHMAVVDRTFGKGKIGLGSFDDMNDFDNVVLRGR